MLEGDDPAQPFGMRSPFTLKGPLKGLLATCAPDFISTSAIARLKTHTLALGLTLNGASLTIPTMNRVECR